MAVRIHSSRIDPWLVAVLLGGAVFALVAAQIAANNEPDHRSAIFCAYLASLIAVGCLSLPTYYTISESEVVARSGLLKWKVLLTEIQGVSPVHSVAGGPAWSSERLQILFKRNGVEQTLTISPSDQEAFLNDLHAADPNLVSEKNGLKRREFMS